MRDTNRFVRYKPRGSTGSHYLSQEFCQVSASWPHLPALAQSKTSPPELGMIQPQGRRSPAATAPCRYHQGHLWVYLKHLRVHVGTQNLMVDHG